MRLRHFQKLDLKCHLLRPKQKAGVLRENLPYFQALFKTNIGVGVVAGIFVLLKHFQNRYSELLLRLLPVTFCQDLFALQAFLNILQPLFSPPF